VGMGRLGEEPDEAAYARARHPPGFGDPRCAAAVQRLVDTPRFPAERVASESRRKSPVLLVI